MESKFVLKSKTMAGLMLSTLVLWAPAVGLDFNEADKGFIMENLHEIFATGFAAFAGWGRIVANTRTRFSL